MFLRTRRQHEIITLGASFLAVFVLYSSVDGVSGNPKCSLETFRRNIGSVCGVYTDKKRSAGAEFYMKPLADSNEGVPKKSAHEFVSELWGYYMREWQQNPQDSTPDDKVGYLYQLGGQEDVLPLDKTDSEPEQYTALPSLSLLPNAVDNNDEGGKSTITPKGFDFNHGIPQHIVVIPSNAEPVPPASGSNPQQHSPEDSLRRTRNAMLKELVVKCCSRGCDPDDFKVVASEYSICQR